MIRNQSIWCVSISTAMLLIERRAYSIKQIHLPRKRPKSKITEVGASERSSQQSSKHLNEFLTQTTETVVTVGGNADQGNSALSVAIA
jgi:hypothetical protein